MDMNDVVQLKKDIDSVIRRANEAAGAAEANMLVLQERFGCETIEEAEKLLREKKKKFEVLRKKLEKKEQEFYTQFGELLS